MKKNQQTSPLRKFADFFLSSAIIRFLISFTLAIYRKVSSSLSSLLFTAYDHIDAKLRTSRIVTEVESKAGAKRRSALANKFSEAYETSLFFKILNNFKWGLLNCQLNILAVFGLTFGLVSAIMLILKNFAFKITTITLPAFLSLINPLMASFIFILVAVILIFTKKPLIQAVNESRIFNFILFDMLCIRKVPASDYEQYQGLNAGVSALFGLLLGALSYWLPPSTIAAILGMLLVSGIILHSPEAGIVSMVFLIPFIPTMALVGIALVTIASFALKCLRSKRLLKLEGFDLLIFIFMAFCFSGGVISVDIRSSLPKMLVFLCFMCVYFVVKNTVCTEQLLHSCVRALNRSASIVACIGILQYFIGDVSTKWFDTSMFADIRGRAVSTFENPNVLGEYLVLVLPVIFATVLITDSANRRFSCFISFMLCSCCLLFTWSRGAWLGFAVAVLVFIVFKSHRFLAGTLLSVPLLALAFSFLLGENVWDRILSIGNTLDSSTMYRLNIWKGSLAMIRDVWAYGIGIGTEAFGAVFPQYALSGTEVAPHTHSLYLQIITETGAFSLAVFLFICFAYMSIHFSHFKHTIRQKNRPLPLGFMCGIVAFLMQGFTDYVWYNYRIFLFFWIMMGLSLALVNVYKEYDRRVMIYA